MRIIVLSGLLLASLPALAEEKRWEPAPVPNVGPGNAVSPSARAGNGDAASRDAPFSGTPTGSVAAGGATSANETNSVGTPSVSR